MRRVVSVPNRGASRFVIVGPVGLARGRCSAEQSRSRRVGQKAIGFNHLPLGEMSAKRACAFTTVCCFERSYDEHADTVDPHEWGCALATLGPVDSVKR